ncbi:MAG: response regulator transcription factor [Pirellulaceae bacterium]|nr:response regulator transcription factor [Pirellulaceae bacterium]
MPSSRSGWKKSRILIVDDHPIVRRGLRELIDDEPDFEVSGEAEDVDDALRMVERLSPDVVIVDLSLKESHGIDLIQALKARGEKPKTLVSTMHDELLFAERVLRAGASGYVSKKELPETIIVAVRQILRGETYLSEAVAKRLALRRRIGDVASDPISTLSNRELTVFEMLGRGLATKQIAHRLELSQKTVETYRENIKVKLKLRNSSELSRQATQWVLENG